MTFSDQVLLTLNNQGLLPGPEEDEAAFAQRVDACLHLRETIEDELQGRVPFSAEDISHEDVTSSAFSASQRIYGMAPTWIPVFFSNYKFAPWHGGCAWIFQVEKKSPLLALLQLRRAFLTQPRYLGLYEREELITHECSHVGRMAYDEPVFEEILAYQSSESRLRRFFGPLLRNSLEALLLVGLVFFVLLVDAFALFIYGSQAYLHSMGWKLLPLGYCAYLVGRLVLRQKQFQRCKQNLEQLLGSLQKAQAVIYRLSDDEIRLFADLDPEEIVTYVDRQAECSLRWRAIYCLYFSQEAKPVALSTVEKNTP